jgi:hypothetical protein
MTASPHAFKTASGIHAFGLSFLHAHNWLLKKIRQTALLTFLSLLRVLCILNQCLALFNLQHSWHYNEQWH